MTNSAPFLLGEADFTHATQDTDRGAPSSQRITMAGSPRGWGRGGGRQHHLSQDKAPLLYNQVVSHPHTLDMDTLNTLLQTYPRSSMMCNGCMSGRVQNSTPCWSLNGK
jgi:hypothetical protein